MGARGSFTWGKKTQIQPPPFSNFRCLILLSVFWGRPHGIHFGGTDRVPKTGPGRPDTICERKWPLLGHSEYSSEPTRPGSIFGPTGSPKMDLGVPEPFLNENEHFSISLNSFGGDPPVIQFGTVPFRTRGASGRCRVDFSYMLNTKSYRSGPVGPPPEAVRKSGG